MDWDTAKAIGTGLLETYLIPIPILLLLLMFYKTIVK